MLALTHCSASQSVCGTTMEWTQESTAGFVGLYEKISLLWDPIHPKYYNNLHKDGTWEESKRDGTVPPQKKTELFIQKAI
jgi:hypothetical protein